MGDEDVTEKGNQAGMKEVKLSVIIPVYKVERTLDKCVESVLSQNLPNMEVILVDDGSPDNCPQLCDKWCQGSEQVITIHKENGGLSDARNAGIDRATGTYITFVDSDDYIERNTFAQLLALLEEHPEFDILEYPINQFEGSADKESLLSFDDHAYNDIHSYWYEAKAYEHMYACNKIYKRNLFADIKYPYGKVFEDILTYPRLLEKAHNVATASKGLYHYCHNQDGITSLADGREWRTLLDAHLSIISNPLFLPATEEYYLQLLNIQLYTNELTGEPPCIPQIHFRKIVTVKTKLNNILGTERLCKLNKAIHKIWRRH